MFYQSISTLYMYLVSNINPLKHDQRDVHALHQRDVHALHGYFHRFTCLVKPEWFQLDCVHFYTLCQYDTNQQQLIYTE